MKKSTKVKMGIAKTLDKLQRSAPHGRCHFEIKIEAYYMR